MSWHWRRDRRGRPRVAGWLGIGRLTLEGLEPRYVLSGTVLGQPAQEIGQITWQGQVADVRPGYWNGLYYSAVPYGQPAIPQSLLPLPTWSTLSLGNGFFSLSAPDADPQLVADWASQTPGVLEIEPDYIVVAPPADGTTTGITAGITAAATEPTAVPNDPGYALQWAPPVIQSPSAWDVSTGSIQVVVAVLDSGIDLTHPDLVGNLWKNPRELPANGIDDEHNAFIDDVHGWNFVDDTNDVQDGYGHGTHVAGIIGAVGNNGLGVAGLAWRISLMPLKILGNTGVGTVSAALAAINYVTMMRRDFETNIVVSNNSWGAITGSSVVMRDAIVAMNDVGVTFVAAAGNNGTNNDVVPRYPSSYDVPNVIAVASSTPDDALSAFSNYGPTSVDLAAPGSGIYSTFPGGTYGYLSGTSMAAPQVAGAVALLAAAKPGLTVAQIRSAILGSTDTIPSMVGKTVTGGRLNINGAMKSLGLTPVVPPIPPPPPPPPVTAPVPFIDDFNQPNSPSLSGYWGMRIGSIGITDQQATSRVAGASVATLNNVSIKDSACQAFVNLRTGAGVGLVARYSGPGDTRMYLGAINRVGTGYSARIWRNNGATWTVLSSGVVTASSGVLQFDVAGSSLTLFFNGIRVAGAYDTLIAGPGAVGLRMVGAGVSADNYSQLTLSPPTATTAVLPFADSFTGADSSYVPGYWTKRFGNLAVSSNAIVSRIDGVSMMALNGATMTDGSVQAFVNVGLGIQVGLAARYTGSGDTRMYLGGLLRSGTTYIGRIWVNNGVGWTVLASGASPGGSGTLKFQVVGSTQTLFLNGRQIAASYNTALRGAGGMGIRFQGAGGVADSYLAAQFVPPTPTVPVSPFADAFIGPDSPYISGSWVEGIGNVAQSDNTVLSRIRGVSILTLYKTTPRDSSTQAVVNIGSGTSVGLVARYTGSGDDGMYMAGLVLACDHYFGRIYRQSGGSWTLLASTPVAGGSGRIRFDCIGSTLTLFLNGDPIASVVDTAITGPGGVGLRLVGEGATVDSFAYVNG